MPAASSCNLSKGFHKYDLRKNRLQIFQIISIWLASQSLFYAQNIFVVFHAHLIQFL